jgi:hypothetical protein
MLTERRRQHRRGRTAADLRTPADVGSATDTADIGRRRIAPYVSTATHTTFRWRRIAADLRTTAHLRRWRRVPGNGRSATDIVDGLRHILSVPFAYFV